MYIYKNRNLSGFPRTSGYTPQTRGVGIGVGYLLYFIDIIASRGDRDRTMF